MGLHSVVVVYIDRAIAALAVTAIIRAPTWSRTGTRALAFALALYFTHGRLSSTGEPESLHGGDSRPPEIQLPEHKGLRPVAPSPTYAAWMPPSLGNPCFHISTLLHSGSLTLRWGAI